MNCVKIDPSYPLLREWLDLLGKCFDGVNPAWIYDFLRMEPFLLLALEDQGALAGTVCLKFSPGWAYMMFLAVEPRRRCGGLGRLLWQRALEEAGARGKKGLIWECLTEDCLPEGEARHLAVRRMGFYDRLGGRPLEGCRTRSLLPEAAVELRYQVMYYLLDPEACPREGAREIFGDELITQ
ncbi:MAG: GNAT family N-acetyltransferase [Abditibacteriota bacterium]|nr:GNAT family N-acetyltransferase [Abditibacteriota bacterium]